MPLSGQNFVAVLGFTIMSGIGTVAAAMAKLPKSFTVLSGTEVAKATPDDNYMDYVNTKTDVHHYQVTYRFEVKGQPYTGSGPTDIKPTQNMTYDVQYVPSSPVINGMELVTMAWIDIGLFAIPTVVFLICIVVLIKHFRGEPSPPTIRARSR
jgi:hypothetical protein